MLLFPGCVTRSKAPSLSAEQKSTELKARLADLPIPLGVHVIELEQDKNKGALLSSRDQGDVGSERAFAFETTQSFDELALFYDEEMEAAGWVKSFEISQITGQLVMLFAKPKKHLLIIADPLHNVQRVRLFYKNS